MMTGILTTGLIIALISIVPRILSKLSSHKPPRVNARGEKYFDIASFWFWFVYVGAGLFCIVGIGVVLRTNEPWAGVGFIALGVILGLPMLHLDRKDTSIEWTDEYVRGFKSEWSSEKHELLIADIVSAERLIEKKGFKLTNSVSQSIYWSWPFSGWESLIEDLKAQRPDMNFSGFET